jgi:outer membrane protein TolC
MKQHVSGLLKSTPMLLCILCAVFFSTAGLQAQQRPPVDRTVNADSLFQERLVALAMDGPLYRGSDHRNRINELELKRARNSWTNLLTVSLNYNDQTFTKNNNVNAAYVYPKYFFGLNIPLGTLLSRTEVKAAKEQIAISRDNQEQLYRNIRADILGKYKQYKNLNELIILQNEVVIEEEIAAKDAKEKFIPGTISREDYNKALKLYNEESAKLLNLQLQQEMLKLEIERIIGTTLENVMK